MSNGKAKTGRTQIDEIISLKREQKKQFGVQRMQNSGVKILPSSSGNLTSQGGVSTNVGFLKTAGDSMMGPIAFSQKVKALSGGIIDISESTGTGYSSYVIASCGAGINDLNTLTGTKHNGQLLFLDAPATVTVRLKHNTGNIFIPDAADFDIIPSSVAILIYDETIAKWNFVSAFARGGGADNLGNHTATLDLKMNDNKIYLDTSLTKSIISTSTVTQYINDQSAGGSHEFYVDSLTIPKFAITETSIESKVDLDMNTFDIKDVDRLKFSTIVGSGNSLLSTDTGIETLYASALPFGMKIQIPSTNSAVLSINRGTSEIINISSIGTILNGNVYLGTTSSDNIKINGGRVHSGSSSEIGIYVTNSTATVGTEGTLQMPYDTGTTPLSDASLNTKFGSINGAMGVWYDSDTTSNSRIYVRINSSWYHAFLTKSN